MGTHPTILTTMTSLLASASDPILHVIDKVNPHLGVSLSMVSLVVGCGLMLWLLRSAAKSIATGAESMGNERYVARGRVPQLIETLVVTLRDEMLLPIMGERVTARWLPFLLGMFFLILMLNLLGLLPFGDVQEAIIGLRGETHSAAAASLESPTVTSGIPALPTTTTEVLFGGTATASISVTAGLALLSFFAIMIQAFRDLGIKGLLEHLCGGKDLVYGPIALWLVIPIIFAVELVGLFMKPAALAIRLFANMVAGHVLLAVLMGFGVMAMPLGAFAVGSISLVAVVAAVAISFLELFVAFLQAFIFMFLTAVFISLMAHEDHGEEHEASHSEEHGHQTAPSH